MAIKEKFPLTIVNTDGSYSTSLFLLSKNDLIDENKLIFIDSGSQVSCSYDYGKEPYKVKIKKLDKIEIIRFNTIQKLKKWINVNMKRD